MKFKTAFKDLYKTLAIQLERQGQGFKDKEVTVEIKEYKQTRTLDQNALMWAMLDKIAKELKTTSEEVYLDMLKKYGVKSEPFGINRNNPDYKRILQTIKYYDIYPSKKNPDIDNVVVYIGSSHYDTKEMTVLIDGIISDCKEAGIDVDYYDKEFRSLLNKK